MISFSFPVLFLPKIQETDNLKLCDQCTCKFPESQTQRLCLDHGFGDGKENKSQRKSLCPSLVAKEMVGNEDTTEKHA